MIENTLDYYSSILALNSKSTIQDSLYYLINKIKYSLKYQLCQQKNQKMGIFQKLRNFG